jgi:hypothetical protein
MYLQQVQHSAIGLGGLMQTGHAKGLLKKAAYKIRAENMGLGSFNCRQEPVPPLYSTRNTLGKRGIDKLSYRDAEPRIRKIGKLPRRTVKDRKQQLHGYFQGKLEDHKIIL